MPTPGDRDRREPDGDGLSNLAEGYRKAAPYLTASSTLLGSILGFMAVGYWLDSKFRNKTPWFLLAGAVIGLVGGFISFFRVVLGIGKTK